MNSGIPYAGSTTPRNLQLVAASAPTLADRAEAHRAAGRAISDEAVADLQRTLAHFLDAARQASRIDTVPVGIRELATRWEVEALERVVTLSSIAGRVK